MLTFNTGQWRLISQNAKVCLFVCFVSISKFISSMFKLSIDRVYYSWENSLFNNIEVWVPGTGSLIDRKWRKNKEQTSFSKKLFSKMKSFFFFTEVSMSTFWTHKPLMHYRIWPFVPGKRNLMGPFFRQFDVVKFDLGNWTLFSQTKLVELISSRSQMTILHL